MSKPLRVVEGVPEPRDLVLPCATANPVVLGGCSLCSGAPLCRGSLRGSADQLRCRSCPTCTRAIAEWQGVLDTSGVCYSKVGLLWHRVAIGITALRAVEAMAVRMAPTLLFAGFWRLGTSALCVKGLFENCCTCLELQFTTVQLRSKCFHELMVGCQSHLPPKSVIGSAASFLIFVIWLLACSLCHLSLADA